MLQESPQLTLLLRRPSMEKRERVTDGFRHRVPTWDPARHLKAMWAVKIRVDGGLQCRCCDIKEKVCVLVQVKDCCSDRPGFVARVLCACSDRLGK
jgi:hypothetical protein